MHKVIIVDDEHFVRKGIMALVDWRQIDYTVIGEADNGEDALALILKEEPDVVLSDIRMPIFDGLELIKAVKAQAKTMPKFIIVSGYNDFQYAQRAVRLGVSDFILKPVNKKELEETLLKLSHEIYEERMEQQTNQAFINHHIFQRVILEEKDPTPRELGMLIKQIDEPSRYLIIDVRHGSTDTAMDEKIQHIVTHFIGDQEIFIHPIDREGYGIILEQRHLPKNANELNWFFDHFKRMLEKEIHQSIFMFVGKSESGLNGVITSYQTAKALSEHRYIQMDDQPIIYDQDKQTQLDLAQMFDPSVMRRLIEHVEENNANIIKETVSQWIDVIKSHAVSIENVRLFIYQTEKALDQAMKRASDEEGFEVKTFMRQFEQKLTLVELEKQFAAYLVEKAEQLATYHKAKFNGDIYKVKRYIDRHYHESLTLKKMANKFFMNPVYLGQLFKKTYGTYFKDYLLAVRIEKAKQMLRQTDLRVYEVAEEVGFGSSDYFVTQFEKIEGSTPSKYRQKLTVENS